MIGQLLRIEWIKTRRRLVFWIALVGFSFLFMSTFYPAYAMHRAMPASAAGLVMPGRWPLILAVAASMGGGIVAAAMGLLVAAEGGWRTQRQNIIDGLSRTEYVGGKLLLGGLLVFLVGAIAIGTGTTFGHMHARIGGAPWTNFAELLHLRMMGGLFLHLAMMATVGIFFGLLLGNGGPALACIVLFIVGQGGALIPFLTSRGGVWLELIPYLPARVSQSLRTADTYDPAQFALVLEESRTGILSANGAMFVAILYIALFAWGGWAAIRYRDL